MDEKFFAVRGLCFGYYKAPLCLKDISFSISSGDKVLVLAGHEMGKTTFLSVLCGFEKNYFGQVNFKGKEIRSIADEEKNFSFLPSTPVFLENKSIKANFDYFCEVNKLELINEERLVEILADFGINSSPKTKLKKLSIKDKRLLAIARSAQKNPSIIFLDDPLQGLLETEREEVLQVIQRLIDSKTTLFLACSESSFLSAADRLKALNFNKVHYLVNAKCYEMSSVGEFEKNLVNFDQLSFIKGQGFKTTKAFIFCSDGEFYLLFEDDRQVRLEKKFLDKLKLLRLDEAEHEEVNLVNFGGEEEIFSAESINQAIEAGRLLIFSSLTLQRVL